MTGLLEIAYNVLLPIFIAIGIGWLVERRFEIDPRAISKLVIYVFSPMLVLSSLSTTLILPGEMAQLIGVHVLFSFIMAGIGFAAARIFNLSRKMESALLVCLVMLNAGNYGLPLNAFAFGPAGEARAVIFYVSTAIVAYTFGVFLASRGSASTKDALLNMFRVPLIYAAALGLALNFTGTALPVPLQRVVDLLGDAAVPAMLIILGMQLARVSVRGRLGAILAASAAKLTLAPLVGLLLVTLLGLGGLTRSVAIVQASMPTAVLAGVLATEFGSDAEFVTAVILVTTLGSLISLSIILTLLGVAPV